MVLENKLGITTSAELANAEEKISKKKALELFEQGLLDNMQAGTFETLSKIHKYLFEDLYDWAGQIRTVNISKKGTNFVDKNEIESNIIVYAYYKVELSVGDSIEMNLPFNDSSNTYILTSSNEEILANEHDNLFTAKKLGKIKVKVFVNEELEPKFEYDVEITTSNISTAAEFMEIEKTLDQNYTYILTNDIDLTVDSAGYAVTTKFSWGAGTYHEEVATGFKGHIIGNGHSVKMTISEGLLHPQDGRPLFDMVLIQKLEGGSIEDVMFDINFTNQDADQTALVMFNYGTIKNVMYKATYAGLSDWGDCQNAMVWRNYGFIENCVAVHDVGSLTRNNAARNMVNVVGSQWGLLNDLANGWAQLTNSINIVVNAEEFLGTYNYVGANEFGIDGNESYTMAEFLASEFEFDEEMGWSEYWSKSDESLTFTNK